MLNTSTLSKVDKGGSCLRGLKIKVCINLGLKIVTANNNKRCGDTSLFIAKSKIARRGQTFIIKNMRVSTYILQTGWILSQKWQSNMLFHKELGCTIIIRYKSHNHKNSYIRGWSHASITDYFSSFHSHYMSKRLTFEHLLSSRYHCFYVEFTLICRKKTHQELNFHKGFCNKALRSMNFLRDLTPVILQMKLKLNLALIHLLEHHWNKSTKIGRLEDNLLHYRGVPEK